MKDYRVVWEIDVQANNAIEAALAAQLVQLDAESMANVFKVYDNSSGDVGVVAPGFEEIDLDKEIE